MPSIRSRVDNDLLFFDFRYDGARFREQTLLHDTPVNRKKLEKVLDKIESEIAAGTFVYANYFPNSNPFQPTLIESNSPLLLPHGICARLRAKVVGLRRRFAVLQGITLIDPICTNLVGVEFPRTMEMQRTTYQIDQKTCDFLLAALDSSSNVTLDVAVCLDWASAQPVSLVFRGIA